MITAETTADEKFLQRAAALSRQNIELGRGGPFGAVIIRDGEIIAEGWNEVTSSHDPTAHAEVVAIRRACAAVGDFSLLGAIIYSSCEPCPMCLSAIYWARLDRLVYANSRNDAARIGFDDEYLYRQMPLAPQQRDLPSLHLPLQQALDVFDLWAKSAEKIEY